MTKLRGWTGGAAALAIVLLTSACASTGSGAVRDRDVITLEAIQQSTASDAFQLIRSERPAWLRRRGALTMRAGVEGIEDTPIIVYLDNARFGTAAELETLPTQGITEIRRLSARDATQRFGTGHSRGAIVISTRP